MAMSEPPERSPARVGYLIARADRGVRRGVAARIAPHDLSLPQYTALSLLRERGGLSNAQLARRIFVTPQSMATVIALAGGAPADRAHAGRRPRAQHRADG